MNADNNNILFSATEPDPQRVAYLIAGYINGTIDELEHDELDAWVAENDDNMRLFGELTDEKTIADSLSKLRAINTRIAYDELQKRIHDEKKNTVIPGPLKTILAVAASLLIITALFFIYQFQKDKTNSIAVSLTAANDIAPGGNYATLKVAGKVTDLSATPPGKWFTSDSVELQNSGDGYLQYSPGAFLPPNSLHVLSTPRGGQYSVLLEDGTRVWLNAESELSYPAHFSGGTRTVQLKGEAYFEVNTIEHASGKQPFVVEVNGLKLTVTGTRFNMNAYANEPGITTSLLEGSVILEAAGGAAQPLVAGEQAQYADENISIRKTVSVERAIAWKNGIFKFENAHITTIMRQVERWYNVNILYKDNVNTLFNASIDRSVPVSKLLRYLELTGHVKFEIKDHTITVFSQ